VSLDSDLKSLNIKDEEFGTRNLLTESARITRGKMHLKEISKLNIDSVRALVIPSYMHEYDRKLMLKIYENPLIRSFVKEASVKDKYLMAVGPSSINLVGKCLNINLSPYPTSQQTDP
jgi:hypothetical protein